jgi:RNA polymerase sigma-70 factor, ECF subfamily
MAVDDRTPTTPAAGEPVDQAELAVDRSFEAFFREEYPRIVKLLFGKTGDLEAAKEIAQEAFLAAGRRWNRTFKPLRAYDAPEAWVLRVGKQQVGRWHRRRQREEQALRQYFLSHGERSGDWEELIEEHAQLWQVVASLPARQAQAVRLHYQDGRTTTEIAAIMRISPNTVKVHLHLARKTLAGLLGDDDVAGESTGRLP